MQTGLAIAIVLAATAYLARLWWPRHRAVTDQAASAPGGAGACGSCGGCGGCGA